MELINRIKKNRKGFTLVEIIVVLVILAILAAFTIPTMLGFVEEARGKALIAEARSVYLASQATATEYEGTGQTIATGALNSASVGATTPAPTGASLTMKNYLDDDLDISDAAAVADVADGDSFWVVTLDSANAGKIDKVVYTKNGYEITIDKTGTATGATVKKL
ncbi:type II secretion system protein [Acetobacterium carbinolicum]|uniref:type II secretion system protein n=1 Tax=Acetobacterium carbinolicum TaxID=52690 RepID=UPI0039BF66B2